MLDLIISYINFLILSISFIVKKFAFLPPDPPKYIIQKEKIKTDKRIEEKEDILFLIKKDQLDYKKINPKYLKIEYSKIPLYDGYLPILIISPIFHKPLCLIYCQGNSGDLGTSLFECYEISLKCNCNIITFEYPGYGVCKKDEIQEIEFYRRIKIVYNYITQNLHYKPNQIILYGFSLGTGIVFDFACKKEYPVAGLILQSPFLSIIRTIYNIKTTKYFDLFNNCDKAKNLCRKTFFIHGNKDTIVPYLHGRILAKLIPKHFFYDFLTVDGSDHNNLLKLKINKEIVFESINSFILYCTDKNYFSDTSSITCNLNLPKNIDNNEDMIKTTDSNNLIISENSGLKSDKIRAFKTFIEQNQENNIKSNSYVNCPLNNIKNSKENIINNKNNTQNGNNIIKINNINKKINKENMRYANQIYNKENNIINLPQNLKQKNNNFSRNYYFADIGTYSRNNKFALYKKYIHTQNNTQNLNKYISNESSLITMNSSTNNITN